MTAEEHNKTLATLHFIYGAMHGLTLAGLALLVFVIGITSPRTFSITTFWSTADRSRSASHIRGIWFAEAQEVGQAGRNYPGDNFAGQHSDRDSARYLYAEVLQERGWG